MFVSWLNIVSAVEAMLSLFNGIFTVRRVELVDFLVMYKMLTAAVIMRMLSGFERKNCLGRLSHNSMSVWKSLLSLFTLEISNGLIYSRWFGVESSHQHDAEDPRVKACGKVWRLKKAVFISVELPLVGPIRTSPC